MTPPVLASPSSRPAALRARVARVVVTVFAAVLAAVVLPVTIAAAHSSLVASSPGSSSTVGGTVDRLDLIFNGGVEQAEMTLEGPDGLVVDGVVEQPDDNWLRFVIEPLSVEGRYVLNYSFISEDTDPVSDAFAFTFDADGVEPIRVTSSELYPDSSGPGVVFWVLSFVSLAVLAIGGGLLAERVRKRRLATASEEPSPTAVD